MKRKPEDEAFLRSNPQTWSIHGVLSNLFLLVKKSNINLQLSYYAMQRKLIAYYFCNANILIKHNFLSRIFLCFRDFIYEKSYFFSTAHFFLIIVYIEKPEVWVSIIL